MISSSPNPVSAADRLRLQKARDDHDNWMLMTPAEILGVTTPEKILETPEQRAAAKKLTTMDRYLARQQQSKSPAIEPVHLLWALFLDESRAAEIAAAHGLSFCNMSNSPGIVDMLRGMDSAALAHLLLRYQLQTP